MNHPLDKIFRDKLIDHSVPVPESAWNKVAIATAGKNRTYFVYRIAAGLLLLCAITAVLVWLNRPKEEPVLASNSRTPITAPSAPSTPAVVKAAGSATARTRKKSPGTAKAVKIREANPAEVQPSVTEKAQEPELKVSPLPDVVKEESVATVTEVKKAVVIEYRLEPVEDASGNTVIASKEKTNFRKVLDFAIDAKNSNPLGNLREAKDDLFAFNFKKDKQNNAK